MPKIEIRLNGESSADMAVFDVTVRDEGDETYHKVLATPNEARKIMQGQSASIAELVEKSFEFLLEREPSRSILPEFHLADISKYFPEYMVEIKHRIAKRSDEII